MSEQLYCIQDTRQYVGNCVYWWRSTRSGYTCHIDEALIVGREEARRMHKERNTDKAWPVKKIEKAMSLQVDIQRLK